MGGNVLSWIRKLDVVLLGRRTSIDALKVGNEHLRKRVHLRTITSSDLGIDAVHVDFAVADGIEPGPGHSGFAVLESLRDGEVEGVNAVWSVRAVAFDGSGQVALRVRWASTFNRVDGLPARWVLELGGIGLVGNGDLTAATAVHRCVGTTSQLEGKLLAGTCSHDLLSCEGRSYTVAREIGTGRLKRLLDGVAVDWRRCEDKHVCVGGTEHQARCQKLGCCCSEHVGAESACVDGVGC